VVLPESESGRALLARVRGSSSAMKFGHDLARVTSVSDPEWAPFFIQYKMLKKYINLITTEMDTSTDKEKPPHHRRQGSPPEVQFFRAVRSELYKSSRFFKAAERVLATRRDGIDEALRQLEAKTCAKDVEAAGKKALSACVSYYRDLLLLENFAIMNYCGFSKILKKHDKRTGAATRAKFMRVCVTPQPFTHYPNLLRMIKEAETLYRSMRDATTRRPHRLLFHASSDVVASASSAGELPTLATTAFLPKRSADVRTPNPPDNDSRCPERASGDSDLPADRSPSDDTHVAIRREESDLIDAILNLRSEASRLRAAEEQQSS